MSSTRRVLVVIPTYNEAQNIEILIDELLNATENVPGRDVHAVVVDDNSPDGTGEIVKRLLTGKSAVSKRVFLFERQGQKGFAKAYLDGFRWGKERGYQEFVEMDADLSHDPDALPSILAALDDHFFVIGSRYVRGGAIEGWGIVRRFISLGGSLYSRILLGSPIRDMTAGYAAWTDEALEKIDLPSIISDGYAFQIEMKYRALKAGLSFAEKPVVFRDRIRGRSKTSFRIVLEGLGVVLKLRRTVK